nr:retrovirus-related Pol polyprotein from transposon 17.6 [Tanacetum cinerariifolium]
MYIAYIVTNEKNELVPRRTVTSWRVCIEYQKDSLLLVVISALLKDDEKKRLISVLKKHKEAFAWKKSDIL